MKRVMFVVSGTSDFPSLYARAIVPLVKYLVKKGVEILVVPTNSEVRKWLKTQNIENVYGSNVTSFHRIKKIRDSMRSIMRLLLSQFSPQNREVTRIQLAKLLVFLRQNFFRRLFTSFKPDLVFVMPDLANFACLKVARENGVPTLTTLSCMINQDYPYGVLWADKIAVPGVAFKKVYLARDTPTCKVEVTGMPYYDEVLTQYEPSEQSLVVFLTENIDFKLTIEALRQVVKGLVDYDTLKVIVKVHPREPESRYVEAVNQIRSELKPLCKVSVTKDADLYELLSQADLVIGSYSTCLLEAMLFDKPVVSINLTGEQDKVPYARYGATFGIYDAEEIPEQVRTVFSDVQVQARLKAGRQRFLRDYLYRLDGESCKRVYTVMQSMVEV